jgi:putative DNA primase/helicase
MQAIGRGRGVRRTAANPLRIEILCSIPLAIEVDEVRAWEGDMQPSLARVISVRGAAPLNYRDMARAHPDLFPSAEAARKALQREGPDKPLYGQLLSFFLTYKGMSGPSAIVYRRAGRGQQPTELLYIPTLIPDPEAWLTERLGPVVMLGEPKPLSPASPARPSPAQPEPVT